MRAALEAHFVRDGWDVSTAYGVNDALAKFQKNPCPLVVTDMRMPDGDGLKVMRGLRAMAPNVGVVFLTAFGSVPEAVSAMREGAWDYLVKPVCFDQLKKVAERVLARAVSGEPREGEHRIVGESPAVTDLVERARQVARTEMDVLIAAESGTGKELLARLIHHESHRHKRPFVAVNCAAFPETLLESELFGYARGAFTGAAQPKPGKFELANTGTILLDEIGEMPLQLQPKLLRALQEREVDRLGDTKPVQLDVRVIATTNQPLLRLVEAGKFRADLYYRLNVVPLTIPPLRERREDVPRLIEHFVRKNAAAAKVAAPEFSPELIAMLCGYGWPGNIRELENLCRRAVALHPGERVETSFFGDGAPIETRAAYAIAAGAAAGIGGTAAASSTSTSTSSSAKGKSLREMERALLESTLEANGGNRTRAARILGICPRTMRNKIREYGLPPRRYA